MYDCKTCPPSRVEFGAEFMWFKVDWPGMDPQLTLETIQAFGEQVIPEIKRATPLCPVL